MYLLSALFAHTMLMAENRPIARRIREGNARDIGVLPSRIWKLLIKQYAANEKRDFHPWTEGLLEDYLTKISGIPVFSHEEIRDALIDSEQSESEQSRVQSLPERRRAWWVQPPFYE